MKTSTWVLIGVWLAAIVVYRLLTRYLNRRRDPRPKEARRVRRGEGLGVPELARRLGFDAGELWEFVPRYRAVLIPKRRGPEKRRLLVPEKDLKGVQRRILRRLLLKLRAHPAAMGFECGKSIVHNAAPHAGRRVVVKLDVIDFFTSTTAARMTAYFQRVGWNRVAAELLVKLTTHEGGLPQGAPTSPRLSNLVNFALDARIARYVERRKGSYTRYADDITISFPKDYPDHVRGTVQFVRRICKAHGYRVHTRHKLRILRRHQQQRVTGLVVNDKVALPRSKRRWLRAVEHRLATKAECTLGEKQLQGWRGLRAMVERGAG